MENNLINFIEGDMDDCSWLQLSKIKESVLLPTTEQSELINNYKNQKHHSRLLKFTKKNLILMYIGNKLMFINKSNLSTIFKKKLQSTYENYHYWQFESEIKMIRILDIKFPAPIEHVSLEEYENLYKEKFLIVFLEKKYIIIECEKLFFLLEKLSSNPTDFDSNKYFLNNSLIIEINNDLNTDDFIILENNQSNCSRDEMYHFLFLNYPNNYDQYRMYLSEIYNKNLYPSLRYFNIKKSNLTKNDPNLSANIITSKSLNIIYFSIDAFSMEYLESNLFCFNIQENIEFYKINFFDNRSPEFSRVSLRNTEKSLINLKKTAFANINPDEEIFDISILKKIREKSIFISGFGYTKSSTCPNKDSINTNILLEYSYDNSKGILTDVKITCFNDTYYPDDIYNFQTKPIIQLIHLTYQEEILIIANSQDSKLESFAFFEEIEYTEIKYANLEDEYKFCLPVYDGNNNEHCKNSVPIGITYIDFSFDGYDKEKYIINADEVYSPYLILVLDNYGRLFFGYIVNKHLTEYPLKNELNSNLNLKGVFKIPFMKKEEERKIEPDKIPPTDNSLNFSFGNSFNNLPLKKTEGGLSTSLQNNNSSCLFSFHQNINNFNNELISNNQNNQEKQDKFKNIILKDNKPSNEKESVLFGTKESNIKSNLKTNQNKTEKIKRTEENIKEKENENLINLDKMEQQERKQNLINIQQEKPLVNKQENLHIPNEDIENSLSSDSEHVSTTSFNIQNKPCEKIILDNQNQKNESQKNFGNNKNTGLATQWYQDKIDEYKIQKEKITLLKEQDERKLLEKFEKDINELKSKTESEVKKLKTDLGNKLKEVEKEEEKIKNMEEAQNKINLAEIEKEKQLKINLVNELKEKMFTESKKNIACNLEVYLEIIKNKVNNFVAETEKLKTIQEEFNQNERVYLDIEKEVENYNLKKAEVENKISSFYDIDYNSNLEYLTARFNNLVEIILKSDKKLSDAELEEFILNNQLNLSAENKNKVLEIKRRYEKMILRFQDKLIKFRLQAEESEKLISKFSNNENINNILELNNKYEGSFNKFVQDLSVENNNYNFNINIAYDSPCNEKKPSDTECGKTKGSFNFNFNRNKFNFREENKNIALHHINKNVNAQINLIKNYEENAHTKLFEEIMKGYEIEYNSLKNQFDNILKEISVLGSVKNSNEAHKFIPANTDKNVFSETALKNLFKNHKENSSSVSQDPFININLYSELKKNLGKVLQNHIPIVEYIDDSGDDFDEIFDKDSDSDKKSIKNSSNYDPYANSNNFREMKKCEFTNIFSSKQLTEIYSKYKEQSNHLKVIEKAQIKAKEEFDSKNKNLDAYAKDLKKKEERENSSLVNDAKLNQKKKSNKNIEASLDSSFASQGDNKPMNLSIISKQISEPEKTQEKQSIAKAKIIPSNDQIIGNTKDNKKQFINEQKPFGQQHKEIPFKFESSKDDKQIENKVVKPASNLFGNIENQKKIEDEKEKQQVKPIENKSITGSNQNLFGNNNLFNNQNANVPPSNSFNLFGQPKKEEIKEKPAEVKQSNTINLFGNLNNKNANAASSSNLFSNSIKPVAIEQQKEKEDKKPEENKLDLFGNPINCANKNVNPEKEKLSSANLFANLNAAGSSGLIPSSNLQPKKEENKKEEIPVFNKEENKPLTENQNINSFSGLFGKNLSFGTASDNKENKNKIENINVINTTNQIGNLFNNPNSNNQNVNNNSINNPFFKGLQNATQNTNNVVPSNLVNKEDNKLNLNKTDAIVSEVKQQVQQPNLNTSSVNFADLFKPQNKAAGVQPSTLPSFGKPFQPLNEANKPGSLFGNTTLNQTNNNSLLSGTIGLNASQTQQQTNLNLFTNSSNLNSNLASKSGFGQVSSLGAPIASMPTSSTISIGFGKNLGNPPAATSQGFAGLSNNNNTEGFFNNKSNQGGLNQVPSNMPPIQNQLNNNTGFNMSNNNQMGMGFGIPNQNAFRGGFNSVPPTNNNNQFFNNQQQIQQPPQQQNLFNRQPGVIKNDYDF